MASTLELFPPPTPPGVRLVLDVIGPAEEARLIALREELALAPYVMRGQPSRRLLAAFGGAGYDRDRGTRFEGGPIPAPLAAARARVAHALGYPPERFTQVIYTVYPAGAGIGWHVDLPKFGPDILGLSLGAEATLRFRPRDARRPVLPLVLPPRSAYVIGGDARNAWAHHLSPVGALRVSVTFRSLLSG